MKNLLSKLREAVFGCKHDFTQDGQFINGTLWRFCDKCGCRQNIHPKTGDWRNF